MELLDNLALLAGLARLLVLGALADSLDEDHVLFREGACHFADLTFVDSGNNRYRIAFFNVNSVHTILYNFRRAGDYGLVTEVLQFARDRAEDATCFGLFFILAAGFQHHYRVFVEAYVAAVFAAEWFALAHHDTDEHILLFDRLARLGGLYGKYNQLPYLRVALFGRAGYFENASDFGSGIVCNDYE